LGTVAIAVSGPAESSSEESAGSARAWWRPAATVLVGGAYTAALAWTSWDSSMDGDDGGTAPLTALLAILVWTAATVLFGYLLRTWAFAVIPIAVVVPAVIGERAEEFDNELRYFNWLLLIVINAAIAAIGVWVAARRAARAGTTEGRSASASV
jgi:hypothetical protein